MSGPHSLEDLHALPVDAVLIEPKPGAKPYQQTADSLEPLSIAALVGQHSIRQHDEVRLAVVCMTKQPLALRTWLEYFHRQLKVCQFYIRVEDTPELARLFAEPPWNSLVQASFHEGRQLVRDNGIQQTQRQTRHVEDAIKAAERDGCTHILHCDDDELLFCPSGLDELHGELRRLSATSAATGTSAGRAGKPRADGSSCWSFHALTMEATYPADPALDIGAEQSDPFLTAVAFRHRPSEYSSYGASWLSTGKAIGVLGTQDGLKPDGPHHFAPAFSAASSIYGAAGGLSIATHMRVLPCTHTRILPPRIAVVLHYESASVARWRAKFADAAAFTRTRDEPTIRWAEEQGFEPHHLAKIKAALGRDGLGDDDGDGGEDGSDEGLGFFTKAQAMPRAGDPAPRRSDRTTFYTASSEMARRLHRTAATGDAAAYSECVAAAEELWRSWKVEPANLPVLGIGERFRVLAHRGITLINIYAPEEAKTHEEGPEAFAAAGGEVDSGGGALLALLAKANVPSQFAAALATAAEDDSISPAQLARGACDRQRLERVARRAELPLGHRLRIMNVLVAR